MRPTVYKKWVNSTVELIVLKWDGYHLMSSKSPFFLNPFIQKAFPLSRLVMLWIVSFMMAGCSYAPSVYAFGSYFPSWLLCAAIGIIGAVLVRVVFIRLQIDDFLPLRLLVYIAVAVIIAISTSLVFFAT